MKIKYKILVFGILIVTLLSVSAFAQAVKTDACINCHKASGVLGGIIKDWEGSAHAKNGVTCKTCHEVSPSYPGSISHNGFTISPVVSPKMCSKCHEKEYSEFEKSLHPLAGKYYEALFKKKKLI